jgi:hypothetical protein
MKQAENRGPLLEIAERDQCHRMCHHDLRLFECDDTQKQADTGGDRELEILRDRIDDVFAQAEDGNDKEDHARAEHAGERLLPAVFVAQHHGEGEEGIEPHSRRERDRIVGVEGHHQARHCGRDAGRYEYRAFVHSRVAEDLRVDEHDVDHGEKGRDAGDELGAYVGAAFGETEIAINK